MIALLHNDALRQDNDMIRMLHGREPVGHDQHGANTANAGEGVLNEQLCLCVDIGGGLVEDDDRGLVNDGAGKAQELPLSGGEVVAPLPDRLIQTVIQLADKGVGVDVSAGLHDLFVRDALLPEENIASDVAGQSKSVPSECRSSDR